MSTPEERLTRDAACLLFYQVNNRPSHVKGIIAGYRNKGQLEELQAKIDYLKQSKDRMP